MVSNNVGATATPPVTHTAILIAATGARHVVTPFDYTPDTYTYTSTVDGVTTVYQYVGTSDGVAFYSERVTLLPFNFPVGGHGSPGDYEGTPV